MIKLDRTIKEIRKEMRPIRMLKTTEKLKLKTRQLSKEYSTSEFSLEKKMRISNLDFEIKQLCGDIVHMLYLQIPNKAISKEEVVERLTDTLGRIMDAHSLKQYILTVLGYKFVSFLVEEELKKLNIPLETITDEEVIKHREEIIKNLGVFILPSNRFEMLLDKSIEEIQDAINKANENTKGTKLDGIFSLIEIDSLQLGITRELREERIKAIIKEISELPLNTDIVSNVYELLLKEFAKINTAEYFTPTEVSKILSEIVTTEVEDIKTIYDCACGSGNLLTQLAKKLNGQGVEVYGQEINKITQNLCKINLLLSGVEVKNINIAIGDTLIEEKHTGIKMDAIVANPPYSLKWVGKDDKSLLENPIYKEVGVLPPKKASDLCFVLHSLHVLSDKGKMAIVLPLGVLYRGNAEQKIRKYLVDNNYLEAVIQLPNKIFLNTDMSTAILVLRKNKATTDVLFIDATKEYTKCGKRNIIEEQHINNILEWYKDRTSQNQPYKLASYEEVKQNDYKLSVDNYVEDNEPKEEINIDEVERELEEVKKRRLRLETELDELIRSLK